MTAKATGAVLADDCGADLTPSNEECPDSAARSEAVAASRRAGGPQASDAWETVIVSFESEASAERWLEQWCCCSFLRLDDASIVRLQQFLTELERPYPAVVRAGLVMAWGLWNRSLISLEHLVRLWSLAAEVHGAFPTRTDGLALDADQLLAIETRLQVPHAVLATIACRCRAALRPWAPGGTVLWGRFQARLDHGQFAVADLLKSPTIAVFSADDLVAWHDRDSQNRLSLVQSAIANPMSCLVADGTSVAPLLTPNSSRQLASHWSAIRLIRDLNGDELRAVSLALLLQCQGRFNDGIVERLVTAVVVNEAQSAQNIVVRALSLAEVAYEQFPATSDINRPIALLMDNGPWLSPSSLARSRVYSSQKSPYSLCLGALSADQNLNFIGDQSLITIAPPGAGKTRGFVVPNLLHYRGSMIVLDVKGECYAATARHRRTFSDVVLFAPEEPDETGHRFNPLQFLSRAPREMAEDARILADAIVISGAGESRFFDDRARDLLVSILILLLDRERRTGVTPTLAEVHQTSRMGGAELAVVLEEMATSEMPVLRERATELISMIGGLGGAAADGAQRTVLNIFETLRQHLSAFEGERVRQITSGVSSWNPADMRDRPITVYIRVSPPAIRSLAPLLRLVIASHLHRLMPSGQAATPGRVPVLAVLDELPQLGAMPQIETAVHVGRSYGLTSWLFAQHFGQLEHAYGPERAQALMHACGIQIWMNPIAGDAQRLSDLLGFADDDIATPTSRVASARALSGPAYRDLAIVKAIGEKPARVEKIIWDGQVVGRME